jgi:hypothetical protein
MALSLTCTCGARFELEDMFSGQTIICPECQQPLQAPSSTLTLRRTSTLALLSLVLALVGAPTLIGSLAAVILGLLAYRQIAKHPEKLVGTGFALTGIVGGLLCLLFTSAIIFGWIGLPTVNNLLANSIQADPAGPLEHFDVADKFSITRPSRKWGVADVDERTDPVLSALQGPDTKFFLVNLDRQVYVDVSAEANQFRTLEEYQIAVLKEFNPGEDVNAPFRPRNGMPQVEREQRFARSLIESKITPLPPLDGAEARELRLTVRYALRQWPFRIRLYKKGDRLYTVRAYARSKKDLDAVKDEVDQIFDSFHITK